MLFVLGAGIFFFSAKWPNHFCPTQSPIQWVTMASAQGVKWQGHEAVRSSSSNAAIRKMQPF
jgi:hypothetical protein